jgi:phage terminase large subunit-like protein
VKIRQLGFDPWNATQLATQLEGDGFSTDAEAKKEQLVELRQGMRTLSEPSKEFEKKIIEGNIRHGGNPVMRWMVDNAAIRRDANDNIAPDKRSAAGRIDGVLASIMALSRVITEPVKRSSVYENRGVRSF